MLYSELHHKTKQGYMKIVFNVKIKYLWEKDVKTKSPHALSIYFHINSTAEKLEQESPGGSAGATVGAVVAVLAVTIVIIVILGVYIR